MLNLHFRLMAAVFTVRDRVQPPIKKLKEAGVRPDHQVLDFGCGPGSYSLTAARMVGEKGRVYCLDILPFAVEYVQKAAVTKGLTNMEFICSGLETGLSDESVDVALLYDTLHHLRNTERVLLELHRVLKTEGWLSVSDHHLKEEAIVAAVSGSSCFAFSLKGALTYTFTKRFPAGKEKV